MDRRSFLSWVGVSFLASSLPVAIAACRSTSNPSASSSAAPLVVGTVADLDANGVVKGSADFADQGILVIRDPANADTLHAVNATCTHQGCAVDWQAADAQFVCPCHGSRFAPDGSVTNGPASEPLATYAVAIEGTNVVVTPG